MSIEKKKISTNSSSSSSRTLKRNCEEIKKSDVNSIKRIKPLPHEVPVIEDEYIPSQNPVIVALLLSNQAMIIPQQIIMPNHLSKIMSGEEQMYHLPQGDSRTPLNPAIVHGLGRRKISQLKQYGINTVEALATINPYDIELAHAVTNNRNSRQAISTLLLWRDRARNHLADLVEKGGDTTGIKTPKKQNKSETESSFLI